MEFEGQYLTYAEYKALGGTLDQTPFNLLEFESRRTIDMRTQNRLKGFENDIPQEVKLCEFSLIEKIGKYANENNELSVSGNIASESTDGYSISYITLDKIKEIVKSRKSEINDTIRDYLLEVEFNDQHLMYVGRDDK